MQGMHPRNILVPLAVCLAVQFLPVQQYGRLDSSSELRVQTLSLLSAEKAIAHQGAHCTAE